MWLYSVDVAVAVGVKVETRLVSSHWCTTFYTHNIQPEATACRYNATLLLPHADYHVTDSSIEHLLVLNTMLTPWNKARKTLQSMLQANYELYLQPMMQPYRKFSLINHGGALRPGVFLQVITMLTGVLIALGTLVILPGAER